jgi:hypothetical protein
MSGSTSIRRSSTKLPDHPGVFGDYLELWDFEFDIQIDPENNKGFTVEVNGGFAARRTARSETQTARDAHRDGRCIGGGDLI